MLDKRTKKLTCGFVGLAATEVIGFGLSYWGFTKITESLDKVEALLQLDEPTGFTCGTYGSPLDFIDKILHPIVEKNPYVINEGSPQESALKFIRYNGPKLVREFLKTKEVRGHEKGESRNRH